MMQLGETQSVLESERRHLLFARDALRLHAGPGGPSQRDDTGELSGLDEHLADVGSETFEREVELTLLHGIDADVAAIDAALGRLARGTYGRCATCGGPIGEARLRALPATSLCLEDQYRAERLDDTMRDAAKHDPTEMEAAAHLDLLPTDDAAVEPICAEVDAVHEIRM